MQSVDADVVFPRRSTLGEGSLWDAQQGVLYWVDIVQQKVMRFDPRNASNQEWHTGSSVGTVVLSQGGQLVLALRDGVGVLNPETGALELRVDPEADKPGNRFNDGKCDPRGRFWAGTMVEDGPADGAALYCFEPDFSWSKRLTGVGISNGLVWSADGRTLFYIDTPTALVRAYDFDPATAALSNERVVAHVDPALGAPDGMAIDADDQLWVALWGGRKVIRVDSSTGDIAFAVNVPANNVTSCAFGGKQGNELYITTAMVGQTHSQLADDPAAGALFRVELPFRGPPARRFAGDC